MDQLTELEQVIANLTSEQRAELIDQVSGELEQPWLPNPGPQTDALLSEADILLYGGAAGGGKSHLLIGCAARDHKRALIVRRKMVELDGLVSDSKEIFDAPYSFVAGHVTEWSGPKGFSLKFGGCKDPDSWKDYAGRARDFMGFDEAAEFLEDQVSSLLGWLRSVDGVRTRCVLASNPPRGAEGAWLITWFAPWLDPLYGNPAQPGELRWRIIVDSDIRWVDGPGVYTIDGQDYEAESLTFIPARLDDNPYLRDTAYRKRLQNLPEPLRSQLLYGDFMAGQEDDEWQIIPSEWIARANDRWRKAEKSKHRKMLALSADIAQGGPDETVFAPLYEDSFFGDLITHKGVDTKDGAITAELMMKERRDGADLSVDLTGGWGAATKLYLEKHFEMNCEGLVASRKSMKHSNTGMQYANKRAEWWWEFRQALSPDSADDICLPPDTALTAQLKAPRWKLSGTSILVEDKENIKKRLKASIDRADAVIQAWARRKAVATRTRSSVTEDSSGGWMG